MRAWPVARSIFDAARYVKKANERIQDCQASARPTGRVLSEASCPNFEPRTYARLAGLSNERTTGWITHALASFFSLPGCAAPLYVVLTTKPGDREGPQAIFSTRARKRRL